MNDKGHRMRQRRTDEENGKKQRSKIDYLFRYLDEKAIEHEEQIARAVDLLAQHGFSVQFGKWGDGGRALIRLDYNGENIIGDSHIMPDASIASPAP